MSISTGRTTDRLGLHGGTPAVAAHFVIRRMSELQAAAAWRNAENSSNTSDMPTSRPPRTGECGSPPKMRHLATAVVQEGDACIALSIAYA